MTLAVNIAQSGSNNVTFRNKIINGAMVIDQRNAGAVLTSPSSNTYSLDRWRTFGGASYTYNVQQNAGSVTPPVGFANYLGVTSTAASSLPAGGNTRLMQNIEGYNLADLNWGSANAKTAILSFWVRSSLTGTFGMSLWNENADLSYPASYTINSANTWEQKTITITGPTSGTWNTTNGSGVTVNFSLGSGSTYTGGTASTWNSALYFQPTGSVNLVATNGATLYITGVQLEAGTTASPFEYRQYGTELALCQRYFLMWANGSGNVGLGGYYTSTYVTSSISFPVTMRSGPTLTQTTGTNYYGIYSNNSLDYFDSFSSGIQQATVNCAGIDCSANVSGTSGSIGRIVSNAGSYIGFSAEL